jgi:hypothetical protein
MLVLGAALMSTSCSNGGPESDEEQVRRSDAQSDAAPITRRCYRNEYPFEDELGQKDVQTLTIEIDGEHAIGDYNWLPAFKDKRVGRFEGSFDGRSVTATYEYVQEGQSGVTTLSIRLEPEQAVVDGGNPELGLNATIRRVEC